MNLNKYTKAELISKLNKTTELDTKKGSIINQFKSYLSQIWDLILTFKNLLVKLTLISFFIKIFRKYKILRRMWTVLNTIVMSIFSLSLIDKFGFDLIKIFSSEFKSVFTNAIDYLSNTRFYEYLNNLFSNEDKIISNNEEIKEKSHNILKNRGNPGGVWTPTDSPEHKVSEWLKSKQENISEEFNEESAYSNYKTYLIILGLVIGSCFVWVYFNEIKDTGSNFKDWIQSFWGNGDPGNNNDPNLPADNRISQRAELERIIKEKTKETNVKISDLLADKGKISSPSLEDLNDKVQESWSSSTSPTGSSSSTETIKASTSSKVKIDSPLEDYFIDLGSVVDNSKVIEDKTYLINLKDSWKQAIKPELRESIDFVENHLSKGELDDTVYITKLLEEISRKNLIYIKELLSNKDRIAPSKLIYLIDINKNVDNWIEKMRSEISKFE